MRRVGGQIDEERPVLVRADELHRGVEEHVALVAGARRILPATVVEEVVVDAVVAPVVGRTTGAAVAVAQPLVEPTVDRPVGVVRAQMPLAEVAGAVAVVAEDIGHRHFVVAEHVAPANGSPAAHTVGIAAGHQRGPSRRAIAVHMEVAEPHGFVGQAIQVRRLDDRIAVAAQVAVALIVGEQDDDIGLAWRLRRIAGVDPGQRGKQQGGEKRDGDSHDVSLGFMNQAPGRRSCCRRDAPVLQ